MSTISAIEQKGPKKEQDRKFLSSKSAEFRWDQKISPKGNLLILFLFHNSYLNMSTSSSSTFSKYGWIFVPKEENNFSSSSFSYPPLLSLAQEISSKVLQEYEEGKNIEKWNRISGGYYQYSLNHLSKLKKLLSSYAKKHLLQNGLSQEIINTLEAKQMKLLVAPPKSGPQAPHLDGLLKHSYVVAFYLNENESTEVSTRPYSFETNYGELDEKEDREMCSRPYWSTQFTKFQTKPGDMMIFAEDIIHRGIQNNTTENRQVIFLILTKEKKKTDEYQIFEWNWIGDCYGKESKEYEECIKRNRKYKPELHL